VKTDRKWLAIGQIAKRAGVNASALRFYEQKGLISSVRSDGSQRLYPQDALRRIAFIRVAQGMGLSLGEIAEQIASQWQGLLDQRIEALVQLKGKLTSCIGCGCLSLEHCALYNPDDLAAGQGAGPRYLLGDVPPSDPGSEDQ